MNCGKEMAPSSHPLHFSPALPPALPSTEKEIDVSLCDEIRVGERPVDVPLMGGTGACRSLFPPFRRKVAWKGEVGGESKGEEGIMRGEGASKFFPFL